MNRKILSPRMPAAAAAISLVLVSLIWGSAASADQEQSNIRLNWTLLENGPTDRGKIFETDPPRAPNPMAEIRSVTRCYSYGNWPYSTPVPPPGTDWSAAQNFTAAAKNMKAGKWDAAKEQFDAALEQSQKPATDPMFREMIGSEYAKLLRERGFYAEADSIEQSTKSKMIVVSKNLIDGVPQPPSHEHSQIP